MSDCCNKSSHGQADEQWEKPVQNLPTPSRKTQLSPELLEFQVQWKLLQCCAHPFPRQHTFKGACSRSRLTLRPIKWKTTIHSSNFLILNTPCSGEMNNGTLQDLIAPYQMVSFSTLPLQCFSFLIQYLESQPRRPETYPNLGSSNAGHSTSGKLLSLWGPLIPISKTGITLALIASEVMEQLGRCAWKPLYAIQHFTKTKCFVPYHQPPWMPFELCTKGPGEIFNAIQNNLDGKMHLGAKRGKSDVWKHESALKTHGLL